MDNGFQSVQRLKVWQKSMDLVETSYKLSARLPMDERFGLISQIRRAATSVPANIAEGFGRWNARDFARFAAIASAQPLRAGIGAGAFAGPVRTARQQFQRQSCVGL